MEGRYSTRSDVWSAGVVFYRLLSGYMPFQGSNQAQIITKVKKEEPAPLPGMIPNEFRELVLSALAKEPTCRYKSALEMKIGLQEAISLLGQRQAENTIINSTPPQRPPFRKENDWPAFLADTNNTAFGHLGGGTPFIIKRVGGPRFGRETCVSFPQLKINAIVDTYSDDRLLVYSPPSGEELSAEVVLINTDGSRTSVGHFCYTDEITLLEHFKTILIPPQVSKLLGRKRWCFIDAPDFRFVASAKRQE